MCVLSVCRLCSFVLYFCITFSVFLSSSIDFSVCHLFPYSFLSFPSYFCLFLPLSSFIFLSVVLSLCLCLLLRIFPSFDFCVYILFET
jgi:hypothetical protein